MKFSHKIGLGVLILGIILGLVNVIAIYAMDSYFPKLVVFATTLFAWGIAMLIFPVAEPGPEVPQNKQLGVAFSKAGILTKIMWILFPLIGLVAGFYLMISLGGR